MQGFKRRNKESKRTMLKNNLKGNIVQQNLSSLYTIYEEEIYKLKCILLFIYLGAFLFNYMFVFVKDDLVKDKC